MAIDVAAICNDIECNCGSGFDNHTFKVYVLQLLCAIAQGVGEITDPTPLAQTTITFGAIGTTYGAPEVDVSPNYYNSVTITNATNQPVLMSVDGDNTILTTPAGETRTIAVLRQSALYFKAVVAPTSGNVRVNGF